MSLLLFALSSAHASPHVAVVVIDEQARDEGYALQVDDWLVEDVLPVEVAEGERVHLVDADGHRERLDLEVGEAWEVTGAKGEAWMSVLEEEVRTDLIRVKGSPQTIEALAKSLDAKVVVDGDATYLSAERILFEVRWVEEEVARDVREIGLVRVEVEEVEVSGDSAVATHLGGLLKAAAKGPLDVKQPVGVAVPIASVPVSPEAGMFEVLEPTVVAVVSALPVLDIPLAGENARPRYAGTLLCRSSVLWLHPAGMYAVGGVEGTWSVTAPGVVRLYLDDGTLWARAAIDPDTRRCRDVWRQYDAVRDYSKEKRKENLRRL